jgi:hypothetical protein
MLSSIRARLTLDGQNEGNWIAKIFSIMPDNIYERTVQKLDVLSQLHRQDVSHLGSPHGCSELLILLCCWSFTQTSCRAQARRVVSLLLRRSIQSFSSGQGQGHSLPFQDTA